MKQQEKDALLALFGARQHWCQGVDARDVEGNPVHYDDGDAVAWDVAAAVCHLFGWRRACKLFVQIVDPIAGPQSYGWHQDREMVAMAALQEFNDRIDTTFDGLTARLQAIPVWRGPRAEEPTIPLNPLASLRTIESRAIPVRQPPRRAAVRINTGL